MARLWRLVAALNEARFGKTSAQLRHELGVSRSTIYRDLKALEDANVAIERTTVNGEVRLRLLGLKTLAAAPTPLQVAALRLARQALAPLAGTAVVRELDGLLEQWQGAPAVSPRISHSAAESPPAAVLGAIDSSLRNQRRVVLEYYGASDAAPRRRMVDPVALRLVNNRVYLFAFCHDRGDYRLFKVARIVAARESTEPAGEHSNVELDRLLARSVRVWLGGEVVHAVVRISAEKARLVEEYPLVSNQAVERLPDGSVLVRGTVNGLLEPVRWALSWGPHAEVVAPRAFRDAMRQELEGAVRHYADGPIRTPSERPVSDSWDGQGAALDCQPGVPDTRPAAAKERKTAR